MMLEQFFDYLDATDSGFAWLIGFGLALLVLMELYQMVLHLLL
jgi:hypothetical protein